MKTLRGLHKVFGGKKRIRHWLYENFPKNYTELSYIEPCIAAGSVFLGKKPSRYEVISDINPRQIDLWECTQGKDTLKELMKRLRRVKYSERTFLKHLKQNLDAGGYEKIDRAVSHFIRQQMSRSGRGDAFAFSERERGGQPGDINAFESCVEQLPAIHERLQGTHIFCADAELMIRTWATPDTFIYLDPPYVKDTRVSTDVYDFEMPDEKHEAIADALWRSGAKFMVSGYESELYKKIFPGCRLIKKTVANNSGESKTKKKRVECLWMNY